MYGQEVRLPMRYALCTLYFYQSYPQSVNP